jgi:predicted transcriptional regulator
LVDDDEDFRTMAARHFRKRRFNVEEAANGEAALVAVAHKHFDVAVIDLRMPGMSGLALLEKLKTAVPSEKVYLAPTTRALAFVDAMSYKYDAVSISERGADMAESIRAASEAELAVMRLLWDRGEMTARAIREALYPEGTTSQLGTSQHGTVQKLLQRLEEKGFVRRDRGAFVHVFRPLVSRDEYAGQQLESLAEKLTDGSLVPFLTHLVAAKKLSAKERKAIRDLLDGSR